MLMQGFDEEQKKMQKNRTLQINKKTGHHIRNEFLNNDTKFDSCHFAIKLKETTVLVQRLSKKVVRWP